ESLPSPRRWNTRPEGVSTDTNTERWIRVRSAWHSARVRTAISRSSASTTWKTSVWSSVSGAMATVCRVAWDVAVIGAGYGGLALGVRCRESGAPCAVARPRAARCAEPGTRVVCAAPDASKVAQLAEGSSYIGDVPSEDLAP